MSECFHIMLILHLFLAWFVLDSAAFRDNSQYLVTSLDWNYPSYAGLLPINRSQLNLFFWYFPPQVATAETSLIVWLQGGPGSSSAIGLFYELGPFSLSRSPGTAPGTWKLLNRNTSWNTNHHLLFIDQPIGTGFSINTVNESLTKVNQFTSPSKQRDVPTYENGFATNQKAIAVDLLNFLNNFYEYFPSTKSLNLFITGESYAGKYIPNIATEILNFNNESKMEKIPLAGIAIGDGFTDPLTQVTCHAPQLLALGFVNSFQAEKISLLSSKIAYLIRAEQWKSAHEIRSTLLSYIENVTGSLNLYDFRKGNVANDWSLMYDFMNESATKQALHLPVSFEFYSQKKFVFGHLYLEFLQSAAHLFPRILNSHVKVLLFQGQMDLREGIMSQTQWINSIDWTGQSGYLNAPRHHWLTKSGNLAGFITRYNELSKYELLNAGHLAAMDQPVVVLEMMENFIRQ